MTATEQKHLRQNSATQADNAVKLPGAIAAASTATNTAQKTIDISLHSNLPSLPPVSNELLTRSNNGTSHSTLHRLDGQIAAIRRADGSFLNTISIGDKLVGVSNQLPNGQVLTWSKSSNGDWISNHALFPPSRQSPLRPDGTLSYQDGEGVRHTISPNGKHTRTLA